MGIEDFRSLDSDVELQADLCIVGSGPAGWAIAEEVRRTGMRVIIVESGGRCLDADSQALNEIECAGALLFNGRDRILGGTSHSWSGRCISFDDIDYERRSWVPHSGWPVGREAVAPFLDRAAEYLGAGPYGPDGRGRAPEGFVKRPPFDPNLLHNVWWDDPNPVRFGERFVASPSANVRVILNATVTHVNTNELGSRVESVNVAHSSGKRAVVKASTVVLCAGGIENARILLYSNRTHEHGLGNQHDMVGRYLMDHPRDLNMAAHFDVRDATCIRAVFGNYELDNGRGRHFFMHGVVLSPELQRREGLLNCAAWPLHVLSLDDPIDAAKRLIKGPRNSPLRDVRLVISGRQTIADALPYLPLRLRGNRQPLPHATEKVGFLIGSEQAPDSESRIRLSGRRDRLGLPMPEITWKIGPMERESQVVLGRTIAKEFARLGLPRAHLAEWIATGRPQDAVLSDGCHPTGATRMSADARHGVVDSDCQVHGVEGLYVAGSSIFPTAGHANPTLMIVAFAVRLAEHLRKRFVRERVVRLHDAPQRRSELIDMHGLS